MQAQYSPFKVHILMSFPLQPFVRYNIDKNQKSHNDHNLFQTSGRYQTIIFLSIIIVFVSHYYEVIVSDYIGYVMPRAHINYSVTGERIFSSIYANIRRLEYLLQVANICIYH